MEERNIAEYTPNVGGLFLNSYLSGQEMSIRWSKYIKTSIRRLDDCLLDKPYTVMQSERKQKRPNLFMPVLEAYIDHMIKRDLRPSTMETREIYASQFLISLEDQDIAELSQLNVEHIGKAFMASSSKEGFCEKIPAFLKYLFRAGVVTTDFSSIIPRFATPLKIPSVYQLLAA